MQGMDISESNWIDKPQGYSDLYSESTAIKQDKY